MKRQMKRLTRTSLTALIMTACTACCSPVFAGQPPANGTTTDTQGVVRTAPSPGLAPVTPLAQVSQDQYVPELVIGEHTVMRLRATAGGLTPDERAGDLRRRLGPILTLPDLNAADVTIHQDGPRKTASIYVRDRLLITVDRNLARANDSSILGLAQQWARNLQETLPQVNVSIRRFDVSTGR